MQDFSISQVIEGWVEWSLRTGHGWPAVVGFIALLTLYTLGIVNVFEIVEDLVRTRSIRREIRTFERQRDQRTSDILRNVTTVSPEPEREVLDAMASMGSQQPRALPGERSIRVQVLVMVLALGGAISACTPRQPNAGEATDDVSAMTFVRHANGLCFGVVRFATYISFQGVSITHVPSEACR